MPPCPNFGNEGNQRDIVESFPAYGSAILVMLASAIAARFENGFRLLLVEPAEKFLETFVVTDFLH